MINDVIYPGQLAILTLIVWLNTVGQDNPPQNYTRPTFTSP